MPAIVPRTSGIRSFRIPLRANARVFAPSRKRDCSRSLSSSSLRSGKRSIIISHCFPAEKASFAPRDISRAAGPEMPYFVKRSSPSDLAPVAPPVFACMRQSHFIPSSLWSARRGMFRVQWRGRARGWYVPGRGGYRTHPSRRPVADWRSSPWQGPRHGRYVPPGRR